MLNRIAKISTLMSAGLVFFGYLKLKFYYDEFDIAILNYLTFSEIITSFLDDLQLILIFVALMTLQSAPLLNLIQRKSGLGIEDFYDKLIKALFPFRYKLAGGFLTVITLIVSLMALRWVNVNLALIYILLFSTLQFCHYLSLSKDDKGEIEVSDVSIFLSILIPITLALFLLAKRDVQKVFIEPSTGSVWLREEKIIFGRGAKTKFLGKTEKYVLLYDIMSKNSNVIPVEQVERISFITSR
jgi:hypothetical protein